MTCLRWLHDPLYPKVTVQELSVHPTSSLEFGDRDRQDFIDCTHKHDAGHAYVSTVQITGSHSKRKHSRPPDFLSRALKAMATFSRSSTGQRQAKLSRPSMKKKKLRIQP